MNILAIIYVISLKRFIHHFNVAQCCSMWFVCVREFLLIHCLSVFTVPASAGEWKVNVPKELNAVATSCVVIPCSFTHPYGNLPTSRLKGNWYLFNNPDHRIYDEDSDEVMEKFKGRTKLLGKLGQNNCTLEIIEIKDYDNGPFCLQIGKLQREAQITPSESHSFVNNCVQLKILRMLLNI